MFSVVADILNCLCSEKSSKDNTNEDLPKNIMHSSHVSYVLTSFVNIEKIIRNYEITINSVTNVPDCYLYIITGNNNDILNLINEEQIIIFKKL